MSGGCGDGVGYVVVVLRVSAWCRVHGVGLLSETSCGLAPIFFAGARLSRETIGMEKRKAGAQYAGNMIAEKSKDGCRSVGTKSDWGRR